MKALILSKMRKYIHVSLLYINPLMVTVAKTQPDNFEEIHVVLKNKAGREVPEPADRRLQTRRMPLWNALDCFIRENLVLPVMYDSVHSVLVKQHEYIQWTNCTKNTLLGN